MTNFRILILDEDPATTKYLAYQFSKEEFDVFTSNNFKEGLILAYQNRPHVVVLDPNIELEKLKDLLARFQKDRRVSRSKLIAFSSLTNPNEIQTAIDLGFYEYIPKSGNSIPTLVNAAKEAAKRARRGTGGLGNSPSKPQEEVPQPIEIAPSDPNSGKTIVFMSAKGGVGTSSICANVAHNTQAILNKSSVLVDMVLPIGSLSSIVGGENRSSIISATETSSKAMTGQLGTFLTSPPNWRLKFLAGSLNPEEANSLDVSRIPVLIENLKRMADFVYVDLGKSLSRISLPIIKSADQVVIVMGLDKVTAKQTLATWKYLQSQGIHEDQVYFIINRSISLEGYTKPEVEEDFGFHIPLAIPYMGRNFTLSNNQNVPIISKFPEDAVTISVTQATREIVKRAEEISIKMSNFF